MKLLIVDDEPDLRLLIRRALGTHYDVCEAGEGREALRLIRREKPRLVLLDLGLRRMSGITVLRAALALDPNIGVVMLTADCRMESAREALEIGALSYVTKPFALSDLCDEIARLRECREARDVVHSGRPWRVSRPDACRP